MQIIMIAIILFTWIKVSGLNGFMLDDCTLQLSHNGTYLDLESTLDEQKDELEGFQQETGTSGSTQVHGPCTGPV
ncbi:FH1/FH2 domain-containing protein 3 [Acipenser ruthenus]|uniref:FH1/FH2 domain-containing protein 3 n=1 Tax=Acipenser ruthenus TaxID=7906 RepID=A0A444TXP0_ACIRT|nr:FH1/FH2 domain-containing protein 3 [Acipenser ruthenus]